MGPEDFNVKLKRNINTPTSDDDNDEENRGLLGGLGTQGLGTRA